MALRYIYDESYFFSGWTEMAGWFDGKILASWWDEDVTSQDNPGVIIQLDFVEPTLFLDDDLFLQPEPITVIVFPTTYMDEDFFFMPASARALDTPDKGLKNEIIRVR